MEKITRQEAILQGMSYYFTGVACKHGHIAKRHVTGCGCVACVYEFASRPSSKIKRAVYRKTPVEREKSRLRAAEYHKNNREKCLEKMRVRNPKYYKANSERIKQQAISYQAANGPKRNKYKRKWAKEKAEKDPVFKMSLVCRRMLHRALGVAGQVKYKRTKDYLPYTFEELTISLEKQFRPGMSWNNYGEWHIDHKIPLAWFIKEGIIDPAIINALDNLQPLWAEENMKKGSSFPD